MLKIVINVFYSLTYIINFIVYFSLFATTFYFGYLSLYFYLYVAFVIIEFSLISRGNMNIRMGHPDWSKSSGL